MSRPVPEGLHRPVEVAAQIGVSAVALSRWIKAGHIHEAPGRVVKPSRDGLFEGTGVPRYLDDDESAIAEQMAVLIKTGMGPAQAAPLARSLHTTGAAELTDSGLVIVDYNRFPQRFATGLGSLG